MVRIYRKTNEDARALVTDEGRAYRLSTQRRALIRGQLGDDLPVAGVATPAAGETYTFGGREPIIDCVRVEGDRFHVTTGDLRELDLTPEETHALLDD